MKGPSVSVEVKCEVFYTKKSKSEIKASPKNKTICPGVYDNEKLDPADKPQDDGLIGYKGSILTLQSESGTRTNHEQVGDGDE